jgi:hypothetical protein
VLLVATVAVLAGAASAEGRALDGKQAAGQRASTTRRPVCVVPGAAAPGDCYEPRFPIRAAFYYPWFPQAWRQQGLDPFTHYAPALGLYASGSRAVIEQHLHDFGYGGIQAGISSWWGQRAPSDKVFAKLLAVTNSTRSKIRWAIYYEPEGQGDPTVERLVGDLRYIRDHYRWNRAYLRVQSRFVVFVYADENDGAAMAARWRTANAQIGNAAYVDLKVFPGYRSSIEAAASWHQYAPAHADDNRAGYSYTISPGFYKASEQTPRLDRDVDRWKTSVGAMVASRAPWQLITSFNEWGEGTAVEPASEWASPSGFGAYLDVLHEIR